MKSATVALLASALISNSVAAPAGQKEELVPELLGGLLGGGKGNPAAGATGGPGGAVGDVAGKAGNAVGGLTKGVTGGKARRSGDDDKEDLLNKLEESGLLDSITKASGTISSRSPVNEKELMDKLKKLQQSGALDKITGGKARRSPIDDQEIKDKIDQLKQSGGLGAAQGMKARRSEEADPASGLVGGLTGGLGKTLGDATGTVGNALGGATDAVDNTLGGATDAVGDATQSVPGVGGALSSATGGLRARSMMSDKDIKDKIEQAKQSGLLDAAKGAMSRRSEEADPGSGLVGGLTGGLGKTLGDATGTVGNTLGSATGAVGNAAKGTPGVGGALGSVTGGVKARSVMSDKDIKDKIDQAKQSGLLDAAKGAMSRRSEEADPVSGLVGGLGKTLGDATGTVGNALGGVTGAAGDTVDGATDAVGGATTGVPGVGGALDSATGGLKARDAKDPKYLKDMYEQAAKAGLFGPDTGATSRRSEAVASAEDADPVSGLLNSLGLGNLLGGATDAVGDAAKGVTDTAGNLAGGATGGLTSRDEEADPVSGLLNSLGLGNLLGGATDAVGDAAKGVTDTAGNLAGGATGGLASRAQDGAMDVTVDPELVKTLGIGRRSETEMSAEQADLVSSLLSSLGI